jgi:hypothetical protein
VGLGGRVVVQAGEDLPDLLKVGGFFYLITFKTLERLDFFQQELKWNLTRAHILIQALF